MAGEVQWMALQGSDQLVPSSSLIHNEVNFKHKPRYNKCWHTLLVLNNTRISRAPFHVKHAQLR